MHAVVAKVNINEVEPAEQFLREQIVPRVSQAPGFVAGYWTRSDDGANGLSMMVFESEDAARGASEQIQPPPAEVGVELDSVEVREVVANA